MANEYQRGHEPTLFCSSLPLVELSQGPSAYQPNTLQLGQTSSHMSRSSYHYIVNMVLKRPQKLYYNYTEKFLIIRIGLYIQIFKNQLLSFQFKKINNHTVYSSIGFSSKLKIFDCFASLENNTFFFSIIDLRSWKVFDFVYG